MVSIIKNALRSAAAGWHKLAGAFWFRLGRSARARHHFERVLQLRGDDFTAYVYLGRVAYGTGDYAGWRREYEHARRTSPERYARLRYPFELFEPRAAGTLIEEAGERATWRKVRVSHLGRLTRSPCEPARPDLGGPLAAPRDDFSSDEEREKFRDSRPIRGDEMEGVDLDELLRRLCS